MKPSQEAQSILVLIKLDASRLFQRIKYRRPEYMTIFSMKRTREHFLEVFKSRYDATMVNDLKLLDPEVLVEADKYYGRIDELKWYLFHTEDLPGAIELHLNKAIKGLELDLDGLNLYIDAQLGYQEGK